MSIRLAPRVELKYCVPECEAVAVLQLASAFLEPDAPGGAPQRLTSLYLESPALTFLRWHVARRPQRFKLRLREYGYGDAPVVFAEIKQKVGEVTHKQRYTVPRTDVPALLEAVPDRASAPAAGFVSRMHGFGAGPVLLVRGERTAYRGGVARALGVTVDRQLAIQPWPHGRLAGDTDRGWRPLALPEPGHEAVLEIKHDGHPPRWMAVLMDRVAPWQRSMSKYVAAMAQLHLDQGVVS